VTEITSNRGTHDALPDERNKDILVYMNGEMVPRDEAKISVFDSGYLVGDGVWEALRLRRDELRAAYYQTAHANNMTDNVHARMMVTRGVKKTPSQDPRLTISGPNIVIIAEHKKADPTTTKAGVTLFTSTVRRGSPDYLDPRLNCHSKLHEVIALVQALEAGADEALMLDANGFVSTCNATNFFMITNGEVWTSTGQYCMNGITRGKIIKVARDNGIPMHEKNFSLTDVYHADEAFVTGSFGGVTPVISVDGRVMGESSGRGSSEMSDRLRELYYTEVKKGIEEEKARMAEG